MTTAATPKSSRRKGAKKAAPLASQDPERLRARLAEVIAERTALFKQREPLDRAIKRLAEEQSRLTEALGILLVTSMQEPDWSLLLDCQNRNAAHASMAFYREANRRFYDLGFFMSGMWSDTDEAALKVMLNRGDPESLAKTKAAIMTVIPHQKVHDNGYVWYGVFRHDLAAEAVWRLMVKPDLTEAVIHRTRYHQENIEFTGTLDAALAEIQARHYYRDATRAEREDDDEDY